jgi:hypothetical protein
MSGDKACAKTHLKRYCPLLHVRSFQSKVAKLLNNFCQKSPNARADVCVKAIRHEYVCTLF